MADQFELKGSVSGSDVNASEKILERSNSYLNPAYENSGHNISPENPIGATQTDRSQEGASENSRHGPSPENVTGVADQGQGVVRNSQATTSLSVEEWDIVKSYLRRENRNHTLGCNCEPANIVMNKGPHFDMTSSVTCKACGDTTEVDPWWMFDGFSGIREEIFRFMRYYNPTKTLCCNVECKADDEVDIVPSKLDRFGIVSRVGCIKCRKGEMSLKMDTENSHKLTVIEEVDDLKSGDEIMFRRWYGISHHAICIKEDKENNNQNTGTSSRENEPTQSSGSSGCCSCCSCSGSEVEILVVSHTYDKEDGEPRIIQTKESADITDVYRVEYNSKSCYPPKWTELIARRAEQYARLSKDLKTKEMRKSNYDPLMENCEHFARRCKTGQSESRQVQACLFECGKHLAMLALRVTILATWSISVAVAEEINSSDNTAISNSTTTSKVAHDEHKRLKLMEGIQTTSICILFLTLNVVLSSIEECRKIRRCQEITPNEPDAKPKTKKATIDRSTYGNSCSECSCKPKCCQEKWYALRYLCRMLFCLVPIRLCNEISYKVRSVGCACKQKQNCDYSILKICCLQYFIITLRVALSEIIVVGGPIAFFAAFEYYCKVFKIGSNSSLVRAAYGFLITLALVLVLSFFHVHTCLSSAVCRIVRCCCCCCFFKAHRK